jgi:uncharacterized protein YdbL (DUF1318 family)
MHTIRLSSTLGLLLFVAACVTINIYFPTAEAVEAADQIIRDVYGKDPAQKAPAEPAPSLQPDQSRQESAPVWVAMLEWLVRPAEAAGDISIQSPAIRTIRASMEKRFPSLRPFYDSGAIGLTRDGLLQVRDLNAVSLRQRKMVKTLVADENRDRNALYREIAAANGQPGWEADIRKIFARRWVDNAPAGWWFQDKKGNWRQK